MHVAASRVIEECCLSVLLVVVLLLLSGCRIASRTAADQHPMSRAPAITYRLSVQQLLHTCLSLSLSLSVCLFLPLPLSLYNNDFFWHLHSIPCLYLALHILPISPSPPPVRRLHTYLPRSFILSPPFRVH